MIVLILYILRFKTEEIEISKCVSFKLTVHTNPTFIYYLLCYVIGESSNTL